MFFFLAFERKSGCRGTALHSTDETGSDHVPLASLRLLFTATIVSETRFEDQYYLNLSPRDCKPVTRLKTLDYEWLGCTI